MFPGIGTLPEPATESTNPVTALNLSPKCHPEALVPTSQLLRYCHVSPSPLVMTCFSMQSLGLLFESPAQVLAGQHSDDTFRGPAVGQRSPVDQPVQASHVLPRPNPAAHLSVASV